MKDLGERWHDRLTLKEPNLLERYTSGKLHLYAPVRSALWGEGEEFIAVFKRKLTIPHFEHYPARSRRGDDTVIVDSQRTGGHQKQVVLISDIEIVKDTDSFSLPAYVGFYRADAFLGCGGKTRNISSAGGVETALICTCWERCAVDGGFANLPIGSGQIADHVT